MKMQNSSRPRAAAPHIDMATDPNDVSSYNTLGLRNLVNLHIPLLLKHNALSLCRARYIRYTVFGVLFFSRRSIIINTTAITIIGK